MRLDRAIEDVQDAEQALADELRTVGERHAVDHDLYHLGHTLASQCAEHVERLEPFAVRYGAVTKAAGGGDANGLLEALRRRTSELLGHSEHSGLLLLHDLKNLYLVAQEAELAWVILGQAAKAVRDAELLEVVGECEEEAQARAKWVRTRLKAAAPQVLAAG